VETCEPGKKILIIDDDEYTCNMLVCWLGSIAAVVHTASNCADALARVSTRAYDVILCDYQLPDGNGNELIPQLKVWNPGTCVIAVTASRSGDISKVMLAAGADIFLEKPFCSLTTLATIVEKRLLGEPDRGRE